MTPLRIDLHVHSMYSGDGLMTPRQIVDRAQKAGLDGVAVTDHGTIRGGMETRRLGTSEFLVIVGAEMMTDQGEVIGLFLTEEIEEHTLERVVEAIRLQGGLVVVPHPFDSLRRSALHISDEQAPLVDAVEVLNSRCLLERFNTQARNYATRHGLPAVAGSDAHYPMEIGNAGIVVRQRDIRSSIASGTVEVFGRRSSPAVHILTRARKIARRLS